MDRSFWNLIPRNAPSFEVNQRTWFNTRKENLGKPLQTNLLLRNRCIIPVNRFFENRNIDGKPVYHSGVVSGKTIRRKESYAFTLQNSPIMTLGALVRCMESGDGAGRRHSCSIITQPPNTLIASIHDRMPFILTKEHIRPWPDPSFDQIDALLNLIEPMDGGELEITSLAR